MPDGPSPAEQEVQQALDACGGNKDAALLLLALLLTKARGGLSAGMLRLPPANRR
ncbi:hypothetical protein SAMN02982917_0568 [Azospirillum oryzae]|uniref:Uncharacterized protein n=1 Tax=Azospirillum oryzae TaxID=286727 RepID=A0A1X7HSU8_9PROT|nr:hypothetical protein [Azospirillum oryzae]SMF92342.1 hypothetical protein SAMN02982917_0568 [Azospirillum oryzae]